MEHCRRRRFCKALDREASQALGWRHAILSKKDEHATNQDRGLDLGAVGNRQIPPTDFPLLVGFKEFSLIEMVRPPRQDCEFGGA